MDLRSNQVGNHGAAGLSEVLTSETMLEELDLQRNVIKDQGAIALCAALKVKERRKKDRSRVNNVVSFCRLIIR